MPQTPITRLPEQVLAHPYTLGNQAEEIHNKRIVRVRISRKREEPLFLWCFVENMYQVDGTERAVLRIIDSEKPSDLPEVQIIPASVISQNQREEAKTAIALENSVQQSNKRR